MMHMFQKNSNIMDVMRMPLIANFMIDSLTCAEHIGTMCTQIYFYAAGYMTPPSNQGKLDPDKLPQCKAWAQLLQQLQMTAIFDLQDFNIWAMNRTATMYLTGKMRRLLRTA